MLGNLLAVMMLVARRDGLLDTMPVFPVPEEDNVRTGFFEEHERCDSGSWSGRRPSLSASSALASWHSCRACSLDSAVKCGHQSKRDIPKEEEPDTHGLVPIQFTDKLGRRENANLKRLLNLDTLTADSPIEG